VMAFGSALSRFNHQIKRVLPEQHKSTMANDTSTSSNAKVSPLTQQGAYNLSAIFGSSGSPPARGQIPRAVNASLRYLASGAVRSSVSNQLRRIDRQS
jgi:hypothetical protein